MSHSPSHKPSDLITWFEFRLQNTLRIASNKNFNHFNSKYGSVVITNMTRLNLFDCNLYSFLGSCTTVTRAVLWLSQIDTSLLILSTVPLLTYSFSTSPPFSLNSARPSQQRPHHGGPPDDRWPVRVLRGDAAGDRLEALGAVGGGERGMQDPHVRQGVRVLPQLGNARLSQSGQVNWNFVLNA